MADRRGAPPEEHDRPEPRPAHHRSGADRSATPLEAGTPQAAATPQAAGAPGAATRTAGHLVLVGLPGSGKTTVGRAVAERLGRGFLDFDAEIERRAGRTVAEIFASEGEPAFRALERALTAELASTAPMVLAPGGGWVTNPGVVALLRPPARIIHLAASPETVLRRLGAERATRPLLHVADALDALRALRRAREPLYRAADDVVETDLLDAQQVIEKVVALATSMVVG